MIKNNEQHEKSSTSNFSKQNEQQISTNLLSPSSTISNFNLLDLSNSTPGIIIDQSILSYGASAYTTAKETDSNLEFIMQSDGHLTGAKIIDKTIIIINNKCNKYFFYT